MAVNCASTVLIVKKKECFVWKRYRRADANSSKWVDCMSSKKQVEKSACRSAVHDVIWRVQTVMVADQCIVYLQCKFPLMMLLLTWVFQVFTCRPSGFQRTFLSRAGVELNVFWGLFFSVRMTPHGSSLKALTRFLSCQPTYGTQSHQANKTSPSCKQLL